MNKMVVVCDICGEEVLGGTRDGTLYPTGQQKVKYRIQTIDKDAPPIADICQNCADHLQGFIDRNPPGVW